jgi:aspartate/methionine/tyrosine aminotransferase
VRLSPPEWKLPREELAAAFGPNTRLLILNSPMNPTGKLFGEDDLAFIAELLERHDAVAICDEVYEHLTYGGKRHRPLMTLPGMRSRTLRIGSAGKTFSVTGWKVGYVVGDAALLQPVIRAHQFVTFTTPPALQQAVAEGLATGDDYYRTLTADLERRRDFLAQGLGEGGFEVLPCEGSYFLTADIRPLGFSDDAEFCRRLITETGVAAIPVSAFYETDPPRHFARFCFAKLDETLEEAVRRLKASEDLRSRA